METNDKVQGNLQRVSHTPEAGEGMSMLGPDGAAALQRQAAANSSPQVRQLQKLQGAINGSGKVSQLRSQAAAIQQGALQRKKNDSGLPDNLKSGVEHLSGHTMDDVHVHYNSDKPGQLGAHAYAQGSDIHIAPGQEQHLPHEAWHVAQQKQGRVQATTQLKGMGVNDEHSLEREADVMGAKALQMNPAQLPREGDGASQPSLPPSNTAGKPVMQPVWKNYRLGTEKQAVIEWMNSDEDSSPSGLENGWYRAVHAQEGEWMFPTYWAIRLSEEEVHDLVGDAETLPFGPDEGPDPSLMGDEERQQAFDGWDCGPGEGIDWNAVTQEQLEEFQTLVLRYGIQPLICQLLKDLPDELELVMDRMQTCLGKIKIFSKSEFSKRSFHFEEIKNGKAPIAELEAIEAEIISHWKSNVDPWVKKEQIFSMIEETKGTTQGQAMDGYQCINSGSALPGQGLHLIIHETMHNIADPTFAEQLRTTDLGDEGLNEYFARLATLTLKKHPISQDYLANQIGSPRGGITKEGSVGPKATKGRGVYGDLMDKEGYPPIPRDISHDDLVKLAAKYFLNK